MAISDKALVARIRQRYFGTEGGNDIFRFCTISEVEFVKARYK
jgi:hypothetical protein